MGGIDLRRLMPSDLPVVNHIFATTYGHAQLNGGAPATVPLLSNEWLELYLAEHPEGNFGLVNDGVLVGFGFSHLWGTIGWLGLMGLLPDYQGLGGGRQLVSALTSHLERAGALTIGIDLSIHPYRNICLFMKAGFEPGYLTYSLERDLTHQPYPELHRSFAVSTFDAFDTEALDGSLERLREFMGRFQEGYDLSAEFRLVDQLGMGKTLILEREGRICGLAVCHIAPQNQEEPRGLLRIPILLADTRSESNALEALRAVIEQLGRREGMERLQLFVPGQNTTGLMQMVHAGYRLVDTNVRITQLGFPDRCPADLINFTRWQ